MEEEKPNAPEQNNTPSPEQKQQQDPGMSPDVGQAIMQRINLLMDMVSNMKKPEECKKEEKVWE